MASLGEMIGFRRPVAPTATSWTPVGRVEIGEGRIGAKDWQTRAWNLWAVLGELRYPTSYLAKTVARLDWKVWDDGVLLDGDAAAVVLARITGGFGLFETTRLLALNWQVAGEAWYVQLTDGQPGAETFAPFSVVGVGLDDAVKAAKADGRIALRHYQPAPTNLGEADSSMLAAIEPSEELLTLSNLVVAQSRSRIAQAGLLIVPEDLQFDDDSDPFGADLADAMMAAIRDVRDASAMVPVKVQIPAEYIEQIRHLVLDRPYDEKMPERIDKATDRIALALDVPAELLKGNAELTHWTAWLVDQDTWNSHGEPIAVPIADLYGRVASVLYGRDIVIQPDPTALLAKRSSIRDGLDAAKLGAVGLKYLRELIGADESDAPTSDELEILRLVPREPGREVLVDEEVGPPDPSGPSPVTAALTVVREDWQGAAAVAADAARRKLGAKIRSVLGRPEALIPVDNHEIPGVVGGAAITQAGVDVCQTLVDGLEEFSRWWGRHRNPAETDAVTLILAAQIANHLEQASTPIPPDLFAGLKVSA